MPQRELVALVVDDDPGDLQLLRWYLGEIREWSVELRSYPEPRAALDALDAAAHGGTARGGTDGAEAREPRPDEPDVVFLDGGLEGAASAELVAALRRRGYEGPVIVLEDGPLFDAGADVYEPDGDRLSRSMLSCNSLRRSVGNALAKASLRSTARAYARHLAEAVRAAERADARADALARVLREELVPEIEDLRGRLESLRRRAALDREPWLAEIQAGTAGCTRLAGSLNEALEGARRSAAAGAALAGATEPWSEVSVNTLAARALERSRRARADVLIAFEPAPAEWTVLVREERVVDDLARLLERSAAEVPAGGEVVLQAGEAGPGLVRFAACARACRASSSVEPGHPLDDLEALDERGDEETSALSALRAWAEVPPEAEPDPAREPGARTRRGRTLHLLLPTVHESAA